MRRQVTDPLTHSCALVALTLLAAASLFVEGRAHADGGDGVDRPTPALGAADLAPATVTDSSAAAPPLTRDSWRPSVFVDARAGVLVRSNTDYFGQAETFGYPVSSVAGGLGLQVGYELLPRFSLAVTGSYYKEGSTRRFAKLVIGSESLLVHVRYAVLRLSTDPLMAELVASLGAGRYWIKEGYSDPSLFPGTITHDGAGFGFTPGVELALHAAGVRFTLAYAYHWAPVGVSNDLGGEVRAGGHELTFGLGARF